jgi:hypothetical protein
MSWLFPDINGAHQIAAYSMCWWEQVQKYAGSAGNRTSNIIEFINPKWADINHVFEKLKISETVTITNLN